MTDRIVELLKNIEARADSMLEIPAGEQFIGQIQLEISCVLMDIKRCLEEIAKEKP